MPGPDRLPALADQFREQTGVETALAFDGEPRELPSEARLAVYRTAQEALTNVRRHAEAERVDLRLRYADDGTWLTVEDRGRPAVEDAEDGLGYGLTGMRERAELLGGPARRGADLGRLPGRAVPARMTGDDPIRVLLADDQRVVREGLAMLLELLPGVEVVGTAADGEEAVALATSRAPDVILMDLRMPRVDGVEATRRIADARPAGARDRADHLRRRADRAERAARRRPRLPDQGRRGGGDRGARSTPSRAATRRSTRPCRRTCWPGSRSTRTSPRCPTG